MRKEFALMLALLLLSVACAAGPNPIAGTPAPGGSVAGFWQGLWHGFILPFAFFVSLFKDSVRIYEVHNSGGWYNFGFVLGASAILGGSGRGRGNARRRRKP
jgi:hypothetical protein